MTVHNGPTVLPKRRIWKDDVTSGLPFREVTRTKGVRANGVMIDDQRVITVAVSRAGFPWNGRSRRFMLTDCLGNRRTGGGWIGRITDRR